MLTEPIFLSYNHEGFKNGLLAVVFKDQTAGYIDKLGKTIWQQKTNYPIELDTLNIDFMNPGSYYAASDSKSNSVDYSGWGRSANQNKPTTQNMPFPAQKFLLQVAIKDTVHIEGKRLGYKVFVANLSPDTLFFEAEDSRLNMKMQAIDSTGAWRDIEYLPSSWCGNSYHTLALDPNAFWTFSTPQYKGVFKTRFRLELEYSLTPDKTKKTDILKIYSNEWSGSVNPAQFWRKQAYLANGLMGLSND
jgi:hypothetical protein